MDVDPRPAGITSEHRNRIAEVERIMRSILTEGYNSRKAGASAPGTSGALLVVFPHGRHVSQTNRHQGANINPHFHRSRTAQNIDWGLVFFGLDQVLKTQLVVFSLGPVVVPLVLVGELGCVFLRVNDSDFLSGHRILDRFAPEMQRVIFIRSHGVNPGAGAVGTLPVQQIRGDLGTLLTAIPCMVRVKARPNPGNIHIELSVVRLSGIQEVILQNPLPCFHHRGLLGPTHGFADVF